MSYAVKLYDHRLNLLRVLPTVPYLTVKRSINTAARISLNCPTIEEGISDLNIAANIAIYRGDEKLCDGRITSRDLSRREATFDALGHEDRLAKMRTPQNWAGWNGMDLADMARDAVNRFRFKRFTTQADWQGAFASNDVNLTVEPGSVMLGLVPYGEGEQFVEHGWIQFRIDLGDRALPTGRIARWSERAGEPTRITIQSRAADSPEALDNQPWGPELTAINVDSVRENEVSGVPLADGGHWVDVRVHLYTTDTTSPDNQTEPYYYGRTPILDGLEIIWREPSEVEVGDIPVATGITVQDGTWNRVNHFKALRDECERAGWQFRVRHDEQSGRIVLDLAQSFGRDLTNEVILRQGDNALITTLSDSDSEYANVLNCWGKGSGIDRLYLQLRNEEAILDRGGEEVEADFEVDTVDPEELQAKGEAELARRSSISPQFVVTVLNPATVIGVGDIVRVADPRSGMLVEATINEDSREYSVTRDELRVALGGASLDPAIDQLIAAQRRTPRATVPAKPDPPANITVVGRPGAIRFRWTGRADVFEIEHTTEEENGIPVRWSKLATVTERVYEHRGLEIGSDHWYQIRAVVGNRTSDWVSFHAVAKDTVPPAVPTQFSMYGTLEGIGVQFTPPGDDDLAYVEVHLSKNPNFTPSTGGDPGDWDGETRTLYDRLAAPTNVGRYDFPAETVLYGRLVAVDSSGNRSAPTNELSATAQTGVDLSPPDPPQLTSATGYVIDLGDGRLDFQVHVAFQLPEGTVRALFERRELPNGDWREVDQATQSPFIDRWALQDGKTYQYRAKAESRFGMWSEQYSNTVSVTLDGSNARPGNVTGLTVDFTGRDLLVSWTPVIGAVEYEIKILSQNVVRRTRRVSGTSFVYTYEHNAADHQGAAVPVLTVQVWAVNALGNLSAQAAQATATNQAPPQPSIQVASSLTQLRWEITSPLPPDWRSTTITAGNYTRSGRLTSGVIDLKDTGYGDAATATVQVVITDIFGQNSQPRTASTTARYLTEQDMAGGLFNIQPEATDLDGNPKPPTSGSLQNLWDNNPTTGASWSSGPVRITFKYPMMWFFDMVRLWSQTARSYYVEVRNPNGQWIQVTAQETAQAADWTVRRFNQNLLYAAREVRITLPGTTPVDLRELKFWTVTLADEILAQVMKLTGNLKIIAGDNAITFDADGLVAMRGQDVTFVLSTATGDAWFGGDVQARSFILPVRPA